MSADLPTANVLDTNRLAALKRQARSGDPAATKEIARQFESLFLQMVLKSMRDAVPREGLLDNQASRMYESLHDQQLSLQLSSGKGKGLGLADMIERQMNRQNSPLPAEAAPIPLRREPGSLPLDPSNPQLLRGRALPSRTEPKGTPTDEPRADAGATADQRAFVARMMPAAQAVERETGIPAHFMVAQAALESGWGRSEPGGRSKPSFNVLGMKAGRNWTGAAVEASTTEVIGGLAQRRVERFRAYGSYEEAFRDYARTIASSPRFAGLAGETDPNRFAQGLQAGGYATDPAYAQKLAQVMASSALRPNAA